jgi:hypothetical protein
VSRLKTRRFIMIAAVLFAVAGGIALVDWLDDPIIPYDGCYPLTVHVTAPNARIDSLVATPFLDKEKADAATEQFRQLPADVPLKMMLHSWSVYEPHFAGAPVRVDCVQSG